MDILVAALARLCICADVINSVHFSRTAYAQHSTMYFILAQ